MRVGLVALWMLLFSLTPATAQVSVGIGFPGVSIGINLPSYPQLVRVPGYPVYYAPSLNSNFFFYDGMYWVYQGDNWYASSWYNGPGSNATSGTEREHGDIEQEGEDGVRHREPAYGAGKVQRGYAYGTAQTAHVR